MPLHVLGVVVIVVVLRMAGTIVGLPGERENGALNFLVVPVVAFLLAFICYRPASQGDSVKRGAQVHDGHQARKDTERQLRRTFLAVVIRQCKANGVKDPPAMPLASCAKAAPADNASQRDHSPANAGRVLPSALWFAKVYSAPTGPKPRNSSC